jgi:hypothetical protein
MKYDSKQTFFNFQSENIAKMAKTRKSPWFNFVADFRVKNADLFKSKPTEVFVEAGLL